MSGTPEYYFKKRWIGMESVARVIGNETYPSYKSSVQLSFGEELQDLSEVISIILGNSGKLSEALHDKNLTKHEIYNDLSVLEARIKAATEKLNLGIEEVLQLRMNLLK